MENPRIERPFDDFKVAITDPLYFCGCSNFIDKARLSPFRVRILLGGRRSGKTSALRAVEWNLLDSSSQTANRAFPVFINLQLEQPRDIDNFRYLLIVRLRDALERWRQVLGLTFRERYRQYVRSIRGGELAVNFFQTLNIKLNIDNPDHERRLIHDDFRQALLKTIEELLKFNFVGVCFLLDESEFIVQQNWANDVWGYLRGLKESDPAFKSSIGLILSGYRDLKEYQQRAGSPLLNIADIEWLTPCIGAEIKRLITCRTNEEKFPITDKGVGLIMEWAGCHPYLTQQMLNVVCDGSKSLKTIVGKLLKHHDRDFSTWWNENQGAAGFGETERSVYLAFIECRQGTSETLAKCVHMSISKVEDAIDILKGTGVIRQIDDEHYTIGARLFEEWVKQQTRKSS